MRYLAYLAFAMGVLTGCVALPTEYCDSQRDCDELTPGRGSICIYDGRTGMYCALPDAECPSGRRWWEQAAEFLRCECVNPALLQSGAASAAPEQVGRETT